MSNNLFLYFKNDKIVLFQSPELAKIYLRYGKIVFCDATFYAFPKLGYKLFITRVFDDIKILIIQLHLLL